MASRADWFADHILPHEPKVRRWLQRHGWNGDEIEDMIQDSYARLAAYPIEQVRNPAAFFFQTVRNVANAVIRRRRIVSIRVVADIEGIAMADPTPNAEEKLMAFEELMHLKAAIEQLPRACRRVLVMRKIEGLSQAETARRLGVSESNVEKHMARAIRLCAQELTKSPAQNRISGALSKAAFRAKERRFGPR